VVLLFSLPGDQSEFSGRNQPVRAPGERQSAAVRKR
jgi:hypothetical protein